MPYKACSSAFSAAVYQVIGIALASQIWLLDGGVSYDRGLMQGAGGPESDGAAKDGEVHKDHSNVNHSISHTTQVSPCCQSCILLGV